MVCEVKVNSIKYLQKKEATDDVRRIINTAKFDELNQSLTKLAVDKYGLETNGENLFENREIKIKDQRTSTYRRNTFVTINRAEPNEPLFEKLQELKIRYDERKAIADNAIVPEKLIKSEIKTGVEELFESNPELANAVYEALGFNQPTYTKQSLIDKYGEKGKEIFDTLQSISWNLGPERYKVSSLSTDKILSLINYREEYNDVLKILEKNLNNLFSDIIKRKNINKELNDILDEFGDDVYETLKEKLDDRKKERGESIYGEEKFLKGNLLTTLKSLEEFGFPSDKFNSLLKDAVEFTKTSKKGELNKSLEELYDLLDSFKSLGEYESIDLVDYYTKKLESEEGIIPQQKQQALQLYSQYLNTIFPNSQVKDIVYHGTDKQFEKFISDYLGSNTKAEDADRGFAFTANKNTAKTYGKNIKAALLNAYNIQTVSPLSEQYEDIIKPEFSSLKKDILHLKKLIESQKKVNSINRVEDLPNSFYVYSEKIKSLVNIVREGSVFYAYVNDEKINDKLTDKQVLEQFEKTKKDTTELTKKLNILTDESTVFVYENIIDDRNIESTSRSNIYFAKPNQIHILGSKQDIEEFKNFVSDRPMFMKTPEIAFIRPNQTNNIPIIPIDLKTINQQQSKVVAETIASKLAAKMGVNYHNVTPEQATEMLKNSPVPYRGEPAFFYNGAVFIVGDNVHPGIVLHEFSHPLLQGLRKTNPGLFNKLYDDLLKTEEGLGVAAYVIKAYPELKPDSDLFKEEVLAFALQLKSLNKLENKIETEGFKSFINRLLASLKQFLREIFGTGVNVKNLNESTSLDELAEMLLDDTMFDFGEVNLTEDDLAMYVRDIFTEADSLSTSVEASKIQNIVNETYANVSGIIGQMSDFKADKVTKDMLTKALDKEGTTEFLTGAKSILAGYQNISNLQSVLEQDLEDLEKTKRMAGALINSIDRINMSSENVIKELNNIIKKPDLLNNRNTIALLGLYKNTSQSWLNIASEINSLLDSTDLDKNSEFYKLVTSIVNNSTIINKKIADIYKKGNIQFFVEITGYMNDFVNKELRTNLGIAFKKAFSENELEAAVDDFYNKVIQQRVSNEDLQKLYSKGVPENVLSEFVKKYNDFVVNETKIKDALTGHTKDVSWFNRWLESYSSSNDIIVGPLAMFIQNQRTEAENKVWKLSQKFRTELADLLPKVNFNKLDSQQVRNMVAEKDQIFYFNKKTGTYESKDVWTFLNEFGNGWRFELDKLEYEYEEAKKTGDKSKITKALTELRQFNKDYMWQKYTQEFYEKDEIFDNSTIGALALEARRSALEDFSNLQNSLQKEYDRFERYDELQEKYRTYQQLYSMSYEDGTPKVDDPAKGIYDKSIAELLIKHRQETSKFYKWVPVTNSLDTAYNEFITELQTKNIAKDSKEYDTLLRKWQKQNIKVVYSDK